MNSLGRRRRVFPGIFILLGLGWIGLWWTPPVFGQTEFPAEISSSTRLLSTEMVVASNAAFRAAEGELVVSIGDPPLNIIPFTWHSPAPGVIACATDAKKCRFDLAYRQNTIRDATATCKVGILDVTVVNRGNAKVPISVWISWRHVYSYPQNPLGFSLGNEGEYSLEPVEDDKKWNPMQTWYFLEEGFIRENEIVYWVSLSNGWERKTWARLPETPYHDLTDRDPLGFIRFQREMEPKGVAVIQILVPHRPLPIAQRTVLTRFIQFPLIPHGG